MFTTFPSLPNPVPHDLHIARDKRYVAQWNKYDVFIEKTAKSMISDFNKTKQALDTAINFYLKAIEDKFFRNQGRNRAQELQSNIRNSNSTLELMNALKEVVDEGNEDQDSLKMFLFKSINTNFCNRKIAQIYPFSNLSYTNFLKNIISAVQKHQKPICLTTFVDNLDKPGSFKKS